MSQCPDCRPTVWNQKATAPKEVKPPSDWRTRPDYVAVDRTGIFGNPYKIGRDGDRTEVLVKYAHYLKNRLQLDPEFREAVAALAGKKLVCWCKPCDCHGDLLADACVQVNEWIAREAQVIEEVKRPPPPDPLREAYEAEKHRRVERMQWAAKHIKGPDDVRKFVALYAKPALNFEYADYLREIAKAQRQADSHAARHPQEVSVDNPEPRDDPAPAPADSGSRPEPLPRPAPPRPRKYGERPRTPARSGR